jgi:hypothetical protein
MFSFAGVRNTAFSLIIVPSAAPHFGGHIERLIGTMMGAVHLLPGTTFSNVDQKGAYDSEKRALLTLPELERWLALQIAGVSVLPHFRCRVKLRLKHPKAVLALSEARNLPVHTSAA